MIGRRTRGRATALLAACVAVFFLVTVGVLLLWQSGEDESKRRTDYGAPRGVGSGQPGVTQAAAASGAASNAGVERPESARHQVDSILVESRAETRREREVKELAKQFSTKYAEASPAQLSESIGALQAAFDAIYEQAMNDRRRKGLYVEVARTGNELIKTPSEIQGDVFYQSITNPIERIDEIRATKKSITWFVSLSKSEYPDLYLLNDEIRYLRHRLSKH